MGIIDIPQCQKLSINDFMIKLILDEFLLFRDKKTLIFIVIIF